LPSPKRPVGGSSPSCPASFKEFYLMRNEEKGTQMSEDLQQAEKLGPFARLGLFYRQIVSELRKVVWPTRNQLTTYTAVVLVFVSFVIAVVSVLDLILTKIVFWVFG